MDDEVYRRELLNRLVRGIACPFCHEEDFDLIGLKIHLVSGWCDVYERTPYTDRPTHAGVAR